VQTSIAWKRERKKEEEEDAKEAEEKEAEEEEEEDIINLTIKDECKKENRIVLPLLSGAHYFTSIFSPAFAESLFRECCAVPGRYVGISGASGPKLKAYTQNNIPAFIKKAVKPLIQLSLLPSLPHQVSINYYVSPKHSIIPHKDGPGGNALILTLGSSAKLDFYHQKENWNIQQTQVYYEQELTNVTPVSLLLEPNSALILSATSYLDYAHGIVAADEDEVTEDLLNMKQLSHKIGTKIPRGPRVSIVLWTK